MCEAQYAYEPAGLCHVPDKRNRVFSRIREPVHYYFEQTQRVIPGSRQSNFKRLTRLADSERRKKCRKSLVFVLSYPAFFAETYIG